MKKIAIGCDPNASDFKKKLIEYIGSLNYECEDYGSDDPIYANTAFRVAEAVARGVHDRGILLCGTGIGMCIAANKVKGAYAALVSDAYSAERAQKSNNANIITLGAQTVGIEHAKVLVKTWLAAQYVDGERSAPKVKRICEYENEKHS